MKKIIMYLCFILIIFISCSTGQYGIYQSYTWSELPSYFIDSNPSTPQMVYCDEYYSVVAGTYEMIYSIPSNGIYWYLTYYIYEDDPTAKVNTYFSINLLASGPVINHYSMKGVRGIKTNISLSQLANMENSENEMSNRKRIFIGTKTENINGYVIKMEYGRFE